MSYQAQAPDGSQDQRTGLTGCVVMVAIQSEMVRCGLATMFGSLPSVQRVISCERVSDAIEELRSAKPGVLVLACRDFDDCQRRLADEAYRQGTKVLVLLENTGNELIECASDCPSDGFLLQQNLSLADLDSALFRLMQGEMPIPSVLARELLLRARRGSGSGRDSTAHLTPREHQALTLLAQGLSNKQIARRLGISEHGVKRHVASVLAKLNVPNRTLAVAKALRVGLISDPP